MTAKQYFSDDLDDEESTINDLSDDTKAKLWNLHRKYFLTILDTCPFPISKDAYNWIVMASLDI